jgi:hypothetical protein
MMMVDKYATLPPQLSLVAWELYWARFEPLQELAMQRQGMSASGFGALAGDERVVKVLAVDGDRLLGLSTLTNQLDAVSPALSIPFFRKRWPVEFAQGRLWYVPFVCTDGRSHGVLQELLYATSAPARRLGGKVFMDFCEENVVHQKVPATSQRILERLDPSTRSRRVDAEHYWMFEFDGAQSGPGIDADAGRD